MTVPNSPSILEGVPEERGSKEPMFSKQRSGEKELLHRFAPPSLQEEEF